MKPVSMSGVFADHVCPICGKKYIIREYGEWAYKKSYKRREITFCSWGCMRKHEQTKKRTNEKKEKMEQVRKYINDGRSQIWIANKLEMSTQSVNYYAQKIRDEEMFK